MIHDLDSLTVTGLGSVVRKLMMPKRNVLTCELKLCDFIRERLHWTDRLLLLRTKASAAILFVQYLSRSIDQRRAPSR